MVLRLPGHTLVCMPRATQPKLPEQDGPPPPLFKLTSWWGGGGRGGGGGGGGIGLAAQNLDSRIGWKLAAKSASKWFWCRCSLAGLADRDQIIKIRKPGDSSATNWHQMVRMEVAPRLTAALANIIIKFSMHLRSNLPESKHQLTLVQSGRYLPSKS